MDLIANRYEIQRKLGMGSLGEVFLARDRRDDKVVCIKILRETSQDSIKSLGEEFKTLSALEHPNLIRVFDFGIDPQSGPYYTMEFAFGGELGLIHDFSPQEFFRAAEMTCAALDFIHNRHIIHGDLKPGNILIGDDGNYRLSDFGLSYLLTAGGNVRASGSAEFMAPEVLRRESISAASDIYSLGLIFYEMIAGQKLLAGGTEQIISSKLKGELFIPDIPFHFGGAQMASILRRMLAMDPASRYQSARALADDLVSLNLDGESAKNDSQPKLGQAKFIGRESELKWLGDGLTRWSQGEKVTLLISGEPGIGKSWLLDQFRIRTQLDGYKFYRVYCREDDLKPFSPILKILSQLFLELDPEMELFSDFGPDLKRLFPDKYPESGPRDLSEADIKSGRRRLFDNLLQYLGDICSSEKAILAFEDIHWADNDTNEFLNLAFSSGSTILGKQVFIVCTGHLDSKIPLPSFADKLDENTRLLDKPDQNNWLEFIRSLLGDGELPSELSEIVFQESGGNYLFAYEIISELVETGLLTWRHGAWNLEGGWHDRIKVPEGVRSIIIRRLERLNQEFLLVAGVAAALGGSFKIDDLRNLTGLDLVNNEFIDKMIDAGIFSKMMFGERERIDFSHGQLRRVAYELLPEESKLTYHRRIAGYFETAGGGPEFLGHHYLSGQVYDHAYGYLLESAQKAEKIYAYSKAVDFYRSALKCAELENDINVRYERLFAIYLGLGKALDFLSPAEAAEPLTRAVELAVSAQFGAEMLAEVAICAGNNYIHIGENDKAIRYLEMGLDAAQKDNQKRLIGIAYIGLGFVADKMGRLDEAEKSYLNALDELSDIDFPEGSCRVLNYMGIIRKRSGDFIGAQDFYRRALDISLSRGFLWSAMNLYGNLGNLHLARNEFEKGSEYYVKSLQISREISDRRIESINLLNIGHTYNEIGDLAQAEIRFQEAIYKFREIGDRGSEAITLNNLGLLYYRKAELQRSIEYYSKGLDIALLANQPRAVLANRIGLVENYLAFGDDKKASQELQLAIEIGKSINDIEQLRTANLLGAELNFDIGDIDAVAAYLDDFYAISQQEKDSFAVIKAGMIGAACGRIADMPVNLDDIISKNPQIEPLRTRFDLLELLGQERPKGLEIWVVRLNDAIRKAQALFMLSEYWRLMALKVKLLELMEERRESEQTALTFREEITKALAGIENISIDDVMKFFDINLQGDKSEKIIMNSYSREARLEVLFRVARTINTIRELDPLLNKIMDLALETLNGERGFILLFSEKKDGEESVLEPQVARNLAQEDILSETTISHSSAMEVAKSGKPLLLGRATNEIDARQSVVDFSISSILCAPLAVKGEVLGIVYVDNRSGATFTSADLDFLVSFTDLAAVAIENAALSEKLSRKNVYLQKQVESIWGFGNIVGRSPAMQKVFRMAESIAETDVTVVLTGESGTGKEILARAIHVASPRKKGRFVPVDCGAMAETLLESELFGYMKGAFTGANSDREGLFETAEGGTVFLDEISNTTKNFQAKLLRVLQENEIRRLGDNRIRKIDVRIIAASNRDLEQEVKDGNFREDLFYRLNVVNIVLPALRDKTEDIPLLANFFLERICGKMKLPPKTFALSVLDALVQFSWPGNVRQLENICERIVIFTKTSVIELDDLPLEIKAAKLSAKSAKKITIPKTKDELKAEKNKLDKLFIVGLLESTNGNVMEASRLSGMDRSQIHHLISRFGISSGDYRKQE